MKRITLCLVLAACSAEKPEDVTPFEQGLHQLEDGKAGAALASFDRVLAQDPEDSDALVNRGLAKQDLGRLDDAIADYTAAIAIDPDCGVAYLNRGTAKFAKGDTVAASADYKQAIAIDDQDAEAYRNRAAAWAKLEMYPAAIVDYTQAMDLLEVEEELYRERAEVYEAIGNEVAAAVDRRIAETTEALDADPNDVTALLRRGDAWAEMGEWADAVADYGAAVGAGADDWPVYLARGRAHFVLEADDKAIADFTKALERDRNAEILAARAFAYAYGERFEEAKADYDAALELDPKSTDAQAGLANILASCPEKNLRDGKRALALAKQACEATEWQNWYALDVYARACAETGALDEATKWRAKAIELAPAEEVEELKRGS